MYMISIIVIVVLYLMIVQKTIDR